MAWVELHSIFFRVLPRTRCHLLLLFCVGGTLCWKDKWGLQNVEFVSHFRMLNEHFITLACALKSSFSCYCNHSQFGTLHILSHFHMSMMCVLWECFLLDSTAICSFKSFCTEHSVFFFFSWRIVFYVWWLLYNKELVSWAWSFRSLCVIYSCLVDVEAVFLEVCLLWRANFSSAWVLSTKCGFYFYMWSC